MSEGGALVGIARIDPCGCQWQDHEQTVLFSHCPEHQLQSRLVDMDPMARDSWLRRLLDMELENTVHEIARAGRGFVEAKQALGPELKSKASKSSASTRRDLR